MAFDGLELWCWELKDELSGKSRRTRYRMTELDARTRHGDNARKIEGALEVGEVEPRQFLLGPRTMEKGTAAAELIRVMVSGGFAGRKRAWRGTSWPTPL